MKKKNKNRKLAAIITPIVCALLTIILFLAGDSSIVCYDLESGVELWAKDLSAAGIPNEPESLFFSGKTLYCVDVKGVVYKCRDL